MPAGPFKGRFHQTQDGRQHGVMEAILALREAIWRLLRREVAGLGFDLRLTISAATMRLVPDLSRQRRRCMNRRESGAIAQRIGFALRELSRQYTAEFLEPCASRAYQDERRANNFW